MDKGRGVGFFGPQRLERRRLGGHAGSDGEFQVSCYVWGRTGEGAGCEASAGQCTGMTSGEACTVTRLVGAASWTLVELTLMLKRALRTHFIHTWEGGAVLMPFVDRARTHARTTDRRHTSSR